MVEEIDSEMSDTVNNKEEIKSKDEDPLLIKGVEDTIQHPLQEQEDKVIECLPPPQLPSLPVERGKEGVENPLVEEVIDERANVKVKQQQEGKEDIDNLNVKQQLLKEDGDDDEMQGLSPGRDSLPPPPPQPPLQQVEEEQVNEEFGNKEEIGEQVEIPEVEVEVEKEERLNVNLKQHEGERKDGRENLIVEQQQLVNEEGEDEEMEGPPPGWDSLPPPPQLPPQQVERVKEGVVNKEEIEGEQVETYVEEEKEERVNVNLRQGEGKDKREDLNFKHQQLVKEDGSECEMEGPPPGWDSLPPPPLQLPPQKEEQVKEEVVNKEEIEGKQVENPEVDVEKEEGVSVNFQQHEGEGKDEGENLNVKQQQPVKENEDDEMQAPSPGWDPLPQPPQLPLQQEEDADDEMEGPPPGWDSLPPPPPQLPPQKDKQGGEKEKRENLLVKEQQSLKEGDDEEMEGPPPGWDSLPPPQIPPQQEMGQMVCGSCRRLLSYPQGSKHVRCSCCLTVNYVLEEHQVGQVKCGNCKVLLMYPFGAQSVRCCSCCSLIPIGDHNRRPPLSVQQSRACRPFTTIGH